MSGPEEGARTEAEPEFTAAQQEFIQWKQVTILIAKSIVISCATLVLPAWPYGNYGNHDVKVFPVTSAEAR